MKIRVCLAAAIAGMFLATEGMAGGSNYISCQVFVTNTQGRLAIDVTPSSWLLGTVPAGGVRDTWTQGSPGYFRVTNIGDIPASVRIITGPGVGGDNLFPTNGLGRIDSYYALAFATNVTSLLPPWKLLDTSYTSPWGGSSPAYSASLAPLLSGEYVFLDLKFWAPQSWVTTPHNQYFRVEFEASSFTP